MNDFFYNGNPVHAATTDSYRDLAKQQGISPGSTRAISLPPSLPGYVVGRSTLEGAPQGYDPRAVATKINIDPDVPGEGFTLDLSNVSPDAFNLAAHSAQLRQATSIEDLRDRASSVFRKLATDRQAPVAVPAQEVVPMQEGTTNALSMPAGQPVASRAPEPPRAAPVTLNPEGTAVKAASFSPQQAPTHRSPAPSGVEPAAAGPSLFDRVSEPARPATRRPRGVQGAAPTYKVTFEVKGAPMVLEAWYHDVVRNESTLVLVYDTSCVGFPRSRLQPTSNDIAVHIEGSEAIYLVKDPAISFELDNQEFQVLLIKETYPFARDTGDSNPAVALG